MQRTLTALACLAAWSLFAATARADYTSRIVTNNARGSMVQTYRSGPGTTWNRTTDISQKYPTGSVRTVYQTGDGTKWSRTTTITRQTPSGSITETYTSGSQK